MLLASLVLRSLNLFTIFHPKNSGSRGPTSSQVRREQIDSLRNLDNSDLDNSLDNLAIGDLFEPVITMAINPDDVYKALRLVPDFDGNPNILTRFINICDRIVATYMSNEAGSELSNLCLINGILNKITGTAASTINSNGIPDSWLGIRTALINNFSDQRDETALYNDLSIASQGNRTPQEFYDHCQSLLSTIMTYVSLHENIVTTIEAKRTLYKKVTMQAFVRGLKEPLGSRIRCMRPDSIEKALEFVQEELNVIYVQQRGETAKAHQSNKVTMPSPNVGFLPPRPFQLSQAPNWPAPFGQRPAQQPPQPFRFNPVQTQPQNRMPTRTQQMFGARPPNYNPQSNVFRLPPRNNPQDNSTPRPMSGVQAYIPRTLPQANQPFYRPREMHMNECSPYTSESYFDNYYMQPEYYYDAHAANMYDNLVEYDPTAGLDSEPTYEYQPNDDALPAPNTSEQQDFRSDRKSRKPK